MCLVERDCDITIGDNGGNLAIHCAAGNNHLECLRFLVKQGTSKEVTQGDGKAPAHVVCKAKKISRKNNNCMHVSQGEKK